MTTRVAALGLLHWLRPLALGGVLLMLPLSGAYPKNVKPDPDGLPPHDVKDLAYGDVLFYFYQDDYFDSITRLLAAQQNDRLPNTQGEAELLLGGLYLSLGEHVEAGKIFETLLNSNTTEAVRNKAWFYLGKVWYQRGYLEESERALRQVSDKIQPRTNAERYMLLAEIMMRQGRYDDAIAALRAWHGPRDWTAYAEFNLGVALVRRGRLPEAIPHLDQVGRIATSSEELLALRDKANLALGFALLQAQRAADARPFLERVRLEGPYSSKALLGVGWADSALGEFKRALVPWLTLTKRNLLDSAVQESYLTVPYAYNQLGATGQAAESYNKAIDSFDAEMKLIDDSIEKIRGGNLLDWLLSDTKHDTLTWYWQLKTLPSAPESRYLYQLLASNEFQEGLKNYRELNFMSRNLESWRDNLLRTTTCWTHGSRPTARGCPRPMPCSRPPISTRSSASGSISSPGSTKSSNPTTSSRWARRKSSRIGPVSSASMTSWRCTRTIRTSPTCATASGCSRASCIGGCRRASRRACGISAAR